MKQLLQPLLPSTTKTDAVVQIAAARNLGDVNPWSETVGATLQQCLQGAAPSNPYPFAFVDAKAASAREETAFNPSVHQMPLPVHLTTQPPSFPAAGVENAFSPGLTTVSIPRGVFWNFAESPLTMLPDGRTILSNYSSKYSRLVHFYDVDPLVCFKQGKYIDGTAIVLVDDIRPLNFCHWLIDALPRLAALGSRARRADTYVITVPLTAPFQLETLQMCGFEKRRIIEVKNFQAVQARELLVTSDIPNMPHPAFKAAPWALSYLQSTVGLQSVLARRGDKTDWPKKLYISRSDAAGRRVVGEDALMGVLAKAGYRKIVLSENALSTQVALFAGASHVIGLHGAGLSHVVFLAQDGQVIEIFPATYGMPTYYVLTAGLENKYASYVGQKIVPASSNQLDDVVIDAAEFERCCGHLL